MDLLLKHEENELLVNWRGQGQQGTVTAHLPRGYRGTTEVRYDVKGALNGGRVGLVFRDCTNDTVLYLLVASAVTTNPSKIFDYQLFRAAADEIDRRWNRDADRTLGDLLTSWHA